MKIYTSLNNRAIKRMDRAIALGVFDGVHLGHQAIIKTLIHQARQAGIRAMVVTFDPDPYKVLFPGKHHPILISLEHRLSLFKALGVDEVLVIRFDRPFAKRAHDDFFVNDIARRLGARFLVVGADFRFGREAKGDQAYLAGACASAGINLSAVKPVQYAGQAISSSRIRACIQKGLLVNAERMLGRPVAVRGTVVKGRQRGRTLDYPTANVDPHHEMLPPAGVYAVKGALGRRVLKGVLHIGPRPTFGEQDPSVEVHFLNYKGNLYGRVLNLEFALKIRPIRRFAGPQALKAAIGADIRKALQILR